MGRKEGQEVAGAILITNVHGHGRPLPSLICTWERQGFQVQVCISEWGPRAFTFKRATTGGKARDVVKWQTAITTKLYAVFLHMPTNGLASPTRPPGDTQAGGTMPAHHSEHDFSAWPSLLTLSHFRLSPPSLINQSHHIPLR